MAFNYEINQLELMQARIKSVPHGWQFTYVGKAFCIRNNLRKPISEEERSMSPGNYPYYGPTKIQGYIGTFEQDGSYALIGEDGDHFLKFEKHSMTQLVDGKCTVNNHAHIIEGTKEASREWFYYYFMHRDIFSFLSRQGAGRYKLNKASLEKMPLLLPTIVEQKKIAQILSTWDNAISVTEKLLANSQRQKKALMQQLLTGKKRLLDDNGVRFSGDWGKFTLSHFGKCIRGVSYKPENICENESDNTIRLLRSTNIQNGELNDKDLIILPKKLVKPMQVLMDGDLAICMANGSKSLVGKSAPYKPNDADYTIGAFCALFRPLKSVSSSFVKFLFESNQYQSQLLVILAGSSINNLKGSDIESINIDAPLHYKEQQKIAAVLSAADAEISTLEKKLACLRDEKKALMQQLLTGKRRVKVDEAVAV
ncbi:TPA: restriction endonuclease subunit S [Enterobacter asburiae]